MNENASSSQLVIKDRPWGTWLVAVFLLITAVFVFVVNESYTASVIFLVSALVLAIIGQTSTVTADRFQRTVTIQTQSLFGRKETVIPFNEVADFKVESARVRTSNNHRSVNYRIVLTRTNGEIVPIQNVYSGNYNDKAQKAKSLSEFLNLPGWQDKPTNLFQTAVQTQAKVTVQPAQSQQGTTSNVSWTIEVIGVGGKQITRWVSADYACPGDFLLVSQKPAGSPSAGGGGFLGNIVLMVYKQILGVYGFLPSDTPGFENAKQVDTGDPGFESVFSTLSSDPAFGESLLNQWTIIPFKNWADRYPLKTINRDDQVGQLTVLYSPRGLQAAILGTLPQNQTDELISLGVELVKAQGGGKPTA
jgi:hypothetical protein